MGRAYHGGLPDSPSQIDRRSSGRAGAHAQTSSREEMALNSRTVLAKLRQNPVRKAILATLLPGVAGAVNATSFFSVGNYTSHVTGNVSRIGDELVQGHLELARYAAMLVAAFFAGAVFVSICAELARRRSKARYALPLVVEAIALSMVIVATLNGSLSEHRSFAGLICFAMGIQNGLVTRISGAVVRTTHLTGVMTDFGLETARVGFWLSDQLRPLSWRERLAFLTRAHRLVELDRLRLHGGIILSFLSGSIIGPVLYLRYAERSLIAPVIVVAALAVFDLMLGLDPLAATMPSGDHPAMQPLGNRPL